MNKNPMPHSIGTANRLINSLSAIHIFTFVFFYVLIVGLFIQLVVLPKFLPEWHTGHGLLVGLDSARFHSLAVNLSDQIQVSGWQSWTLRPDGQSPAGIAAAIYALTIPEPWTLLPLIAALHSIGAVMIWQITRKLFRDTWVATLAVTPFIFFLSSLQWNAQVQKDGFTIAGSLMVLWGLIIWEETVHSPLPQISIDIVKGGSWIAAGAFLAWIPRPYFLQILTLAVIGGMIIILGEFLYQWYRQKQSSYLRQSQEIIIFFVRLC